MNTKTQSNPPVGVIEGFYGIQWTWEERKRAVEFLSDNGFSFYIYAPKGDQMLRKNWRSDWDKETRLELELLAQKCTNRGIDFGIGFSVFGVEDLMLADIKDDLEIKIKSINTLGANILTIQFDDMRGDIPGLANKQIEIVHFIKGISSAKRIIFCPTYYSSSASLDRIFGKRSESYLQEIGEHLDPTVDIFWTGQEVRSVSYPIEHLEEISKTLKRKPFIWDNYPVNDGKKRWIFLNLLPADRPVSILDQVAGIACNPMNQPYLSQVPLYAISRSLGLMPYKETVSLFEDSCKSVCEEGLANELIRDTKDFQFLGLTNLRDKEALIGIYQKYSDTPYGKEILRWLNGDYIFSEDLYMG